MITINHQITTGTLDRVIMTLHKDFQYYPIHLFAHGRFEIPSSLTSGKATSPSRIWQWTMNNEWPWRISPLSKWNVTLEILFKLLVEDDLIVIISLKGWDAFETNYILRTITFASPIVITIMGNYCPFVGMIISQFTKTVLCWRCPPNGDADGTKGHVSLSKISFPLNFPSSIIFYYRTFM